MKQPKPITVDFETFGITGRPDYPPKPVGVSIKYPGQKAHYYAWGHPTKNNCTWQDANVALTKAYYDTSTVKAGSCAPHNELLFQNGKFDVDVAAQHFGLRVPDWDKIHDTMFLLFLDDPHQMELSLKPSADRLLNMPAEEQDAVADWLIEHQPIPDVKISRSRQSPHYFARYIAYAPGDLVGKYANGDTIRTEKLFKLLWPKIKRNGMLGAYDRERQLMPILLDMERRGVPVDLEQLEADIDNYQHILHIIDVWIKRKLKVKEINLNSGQQLVNAMVAAKRADPKLIPLTETGKFQFNKDALLLGVTDKTLLAVLKYRTQLNTCMHTFMEPWLEVAQRSKGLIFTTWNQVKNDIGVGTRTGRLSSTPNFMNIPKEFDPLFKHEKRGLPTCPWPNLLPLPLVRSYIKPFKGHVLIDRDYSQQEPRILAHFDGGQLMQKFLDNPWTDFHDYARAELIKMGKYYERGPVKITNLGLIYGMGVPKLAAATNLSVDEARELKTAILSLYPGLQAMYREMKARAAAGEPIRTWGGRQYYCEDPKIINGQIKKFDYKMVNVLIQGSAADCTKEAIIQFSHQCYTDWYILLNVHDQITVSVPKREVKLAMDKLCNAMQKVKFDVPMLTEGKISGTNWGALKDYDKQGVII